MGDWSDTSKVKALNVAKEDMAFAGGIDKSALAHERSTMNAPDSGMGRSPLVDANHPGFPVLIHTDGENAVHEKETRRFRKDLQKLGFFQQVAPVGSEDEAAFLAAAAKLFNERLQGSEEGPPAEPQ